MRRVVILAVLVFLSAGMAFAENPPNYATLKLGAYLPQSSDMEEFDNGFYGELGLGHYFNRNFALDFGVGYTKSSASASAFGSSASLDISIIPITLGLKGAIPSGRVEPYVTAGVGAYMTEIEASVSIPGFAGSASENDTAFGFYVGLGANVDLAQNFFLGLEGKYFWAEPSFDGLDVKIDGINLTGNIGLRF